jgi:hypothetical protein
MALFITLHAFGQEAPPGSREELFIAPLFEANLYSGSSTALGGGITAGWGDGTAMGIKTLYCADREGLRILELLVFLRCYLLQNSGRGWKNRGPFVQAETGAAIFGRDGLSVPAKLGSPSAGLLVGWRLPLGKRYYVEPSIRAGYPYVAGAGIAAGFRW